MFFFQKPPSHRWENANIAGKAALGPSSLSSGDLPIDGVLPELYPQQKGYHDLDNQLQASGLWSFVSRSRSSFNPAFVRAFYSNLRRDGDTIRSSINLYDIEIDLATFARVAGLPTRGDDITTYGRDDWILNNEAVVIRELGITNLIRHSGAPTIHSAPPEKRLLLYILTRILRPRDGNYILQNVMYGTRLLLNPEIDIVTAFRQRAVKPDGAMYYCAYCSSRVFNVTPRYLIKLSVKDDSGTTTFVLFDREASNILNISCAELMEKSDLAGSFENPKEFDDLLLGKTYIFKVEVRVMNHGQHEHSFRVSKVCHDDTIKKKYLESIHAKNSKAAVNRAIPVYSVEEEVLNRTLAKTIESLKDCTEDGEYAVYGTIKGVDGEADWFIPTCRCGSYRIKARVNDASDSATFVIFESLGCLLLHKSCSEMLKLSEGVPVGCEQPDVFKQMLLEKSFIFKVEVKTANINDFEPSYNMNDMCFNDRIIAKFMEMHSSFFSPQIRLSGIQLMGKQTQKSFQLAMHRLA
ncbi:unnamed protein product [Cuscuta campestris]|uniref:Replication factor A C-terminal domain-containing protein n=1 Tax=Cuscuta campestris TaxID=132261 RepID=A0A484M5Q1_9ASTE|nr:unnamed protein product [Cuscuta campestris]